MSAPIRIPDHAAQSVAHLTERFRDATVVAAVATSLGNAVQRLEDAIFQVLYSGLIGTSTVLFPKAPPDPTTGAADTTNAEIGTIVLDGNGVALDQLGSVLDEPRGGLVDADYLVLLKCKILTLRSRGKTKDIEALLAAASPAGSPWSYDPVWPCGFVARVVGPTGPTPIGRFLLKAAPAGVGVWLETNAAPVTASLYADTSVGSVAVAGSLLADSSIGSVTGAGLAENGQFLL